MTDFLNEQEFTQLQQDIAAGKARLSIPRSVSRQFFLRVDNKSIKATTGESALGKKLLVWLGTIVAPLLFALCAVIIILEAGVMAALAVPLVGIIWTVLAGFTSETGDWPSATSAVALTLIVYLFAQQAYTLALFFFALSLWLHRMTYILAEYFLSQIVASSFPAYDMLVDHIKLETSDD
ncbi:MAG: hypothetical protein WD356_06865 [Pseudomonadales bacterium]